MLSIKVHGTLTVLDDRTLLHFKYLCSKTMKHIFSGERQYSERNTVQFVTSLAAALFYLFFLIKKMMVMINF